MVARFAPRVMGWTIVLMLAAAGAATASAGAVRRDAKLAVGGNVYEPCVEYRHHGRKLACCDCGPRIQTVLLVKNPVTCCEALVPVCLPACCTDVPCEASRAGLFRRGVVVYDWNCGLRIKVVFDKHGDAVVHYFGA